MATKLVFSQEVSNLMSPTRGNPIRTCIQCGTCSGSCPVAPFMDHTPRRLIAMVNADLEDEVLASNTYWYCASCYQCTVRCPRGIDIAEVMYALDRYSLKKNRYKKGLVGPGFSETFVNIVHGTGRSYEPLLAPSYIFSYGPKGFFGEVQTAMGLMLKGRIPLLPSRVKRLQGFRQMFSRASSDGGAS